ncbi:RecX family transcriptional regulator [Candidatus Saccharibacteria bacterium]|nr:RecX family transcriptional regulator [Candidatus Saccharibacteria bacterium]
MEILTNKHKCDNITTSAGSAANSFLVSDIKQAVKNPNRVNVFVDGKYSFSLDIAQVVDFGLKKGQTLTPEKLAEYKKASEFGKLYQRTLEWVLTRPHSVRETKDYLYRKSVKRAISSSSDHKPGQNPKSQASLRTISLADDDRTKTRSSFSDHKPGRAPLSVSEKESSSFGEDIIQEVISRLVEKGYLDDQKFAEYYVENRFVKKGISQKRLRMELIKKGVDKSIIDDTLESTARNDEEEIQKIIAKKRARYDDDKLIQYLVRQGFDYALSKKLVLETDSQN